MLITPGIRLPFLTHLRTHSGTSDPFRDTSTYKNNTILHPRLASHSVWWNPTKTVLSRNGSILHIRHRSTRWSSTSENGTISIRQASFLHRAIRSHVRIPLNTPGGRIVVPRMLGIHWDASQYLSRMVNGADRHWTDGWNDCADI